MAAKRQRSTRRRRARLPGWLRRWRSPPPRPPARGCRGARRDRSRRADGGPSSGAAPAGVVRTRSRQSTARVADSTSSDRSRVANRSRSASRTTRSGFRWSVSAARRVVPTRWQRRRAASGRLTKRSGQLGRAAGVVEQVAHVEQPEVRVGALRQPAEEQGQDLLHQPRRASEAAGQLADGGLGAWPVGEAERASAGPRSPRAESSSSSSSAANASNSGRK